MKNKTTSKLSRYTAHRNHPRSAIIFVCKENMRRHELRTVKAWSALFHRRWKQPRRRTEWPPFHSSWNVLSERIRAYIQWTRLNTNLYRIERTCPQVCVYQEQLKCEIHQQIVDLRESCAEPANGGRPTTFHLALLLVVCFSIF